MFQKLLKKSNLTKHKKPKHIAIVINGVIEWMNLKKKSIDESMNQSFKNIYVLLNYQVNENIPIISIKIKNSIITEKLSEYLVAFLNMIKKNDLIHKNKIKISFLGKWYDLPGEIVEEIRSTISQTKDYDNFFFNICLNYDGQEEIVDSCKLIARKIQAGRISYMDINENLIKENIYSSYYLPPDLMIITGKKKHIGGMLLWDSVNTKIYFSDEFWPDFKKENLYKSIEFYINN